MHSPTVIFSNARWDSQRSDLHYGPKSIDRQVNERQDGKTKVIHNGTDASIHVAYEEAVELTNSFSSSITKGVTLDMTKDASVDTSVTVKGEYAGVGAEASVAAHFGVSESKQTSSEEGKEKSEALDGDAGATISRGPSPRAWQSTSTRSRCPTTSSRSPRRTSRHPSRSTSMA